MDWIGDPRWWTWLVAVAALGLSIYNTIQARRQPGRDRQQLLWDELRNVLQPLPPLLQSATSGLTYGLDVEEVPTELADAPRRLRELAPRFKETESVELTVLSAELSLALQRWADCLSRQRILSEDDAIEGARAEGRHDWAARRELLVRRRDGAHGDLGRQLRDVGARVGAQMKRLDSRDSGA